MRLSAVDAVLSDGSFEFVYGHGFSAELCDRRREAVYTRCGVFCIDARGGDGNVIYLPEGLVAASFKLKLHNAKVYLPPVAALGFSAVCSDSDMVCTSIRARDISLRMGRGRTEISAKPERSAFFECGAGELIVRLNGGEGDYRLKWERGVGTVAVGGVPRPRSGSIGEGGIGVFARCGMGSAEIIYEGAEAGESIKNE